jgi:hypothetical protein
MKNFSSLAIAGALACAALSGCSTPADSGIYPPFADRGPVFTPDSGRSSGLRNEESMLRANYAAADELSRQLKRQDGWERGALVVATPADVSNLGTSSPLGRITGDQLSSRLTQLGFRVVEVRQMNALEYSSSEGVFNLSQDAAKVASDHAAWAVVTTTYAQGRTGVMVTLRSVAVASGETLASVDYILPKDPVLLSSAR